MIVLLAVTNSTSAGTISARSGVPVSARGVSMYVATSCASAMHAPSATQVSMRSAMNVADAGSSDSTAPITPNCTILSRQISGHSA